MTKTRYLLCPGSVISREDGGLHHISAAELASLYGVPYSECWVERISESYPLDIIRLYPRRDGDYTLP